MAYRWLKEENIKSIPELLKSMAVRMGKKTALIYYGKRISYGKLYNLCTKVSRYVRLHSNPGDRVAILMPNIPQFAFCYYGALMADRITVPVNFMSIGNDLKSKNPVDIKVTDEIKSQIIDSKPAIIFVADVLYPVLKQIAIDWPCQIVATSSGDFLPFLDRKSTRLNSSH